MSSMNGAGYDTAMHPHAPLQPHGYDDSVAGKLWSMRQRSARENTPAVQRTCEIEQPRGALFVCLRQTGSQSHHSRFDVCRMGFKLVDDQDFGAHAARPSRISMWSRRLPKSIGLVSSASAPPSKAFCLVSASQ